MIEDYSGKVLDVILFLFPRKALYHLGEYDEARKVIKTARELLGKSFCSNHQHLLFCSGANPLIDECELYTAKSWLTLGE